MKLLNRKGGELQLLGMGVFYLGGAFTGVLPLPFRVKAGSAGSVQNIL
jgi:hypothetical protein